jgi:hypothetical protein
MTPFARAYYPPEAFDYHRYMAPPANLTKVAAKQVVKEMQSDVIWKNDVYQVAVRVYSNGNLRHLSIKRIDREPIHDWRDLQHIKNELCGEDSEAVEIYPAEARRVDTANQYHLWCFPRSYRIPFGFGTRLVTEASFHGSVQRPFASFDHSKKEQA